MLIYELGSLDLLAVNDAFVTQYGYSQSEALSLKLTDLYPEQGRKAITDLSNQLHGHTYAGEWHHLKKDGTRIIIEAYSHGLSFENHDARIAVINDITERKLAEEKLHKQEEKLRVTLDNMMEGCQIIGFDWKYQYLNKAAIIQSHLQEKELLGKSFLELWPGAGETELFAGMKTCMEERVTRHMENKFVFPDGTAELFDLSIQPIPEGIFILSINITERKKAEDALRESEEDYRRLFENHSAIKFIIDPETGNIHDANYAAAKYYGWSQEELKTMNVYQINTLSAEGVKEAINSARNIGKEHFEFKHRKSDGSIHDVEVFPNSITMKGKEYLHSIVVDITERKQAENKIIKANRVYAFISQINQTIVRVRDRNELFKESCRIAIDFGKFQMAWIGFKDEETQVVKPVAISGNEDNYLSVIPKISFIEVPEGKGPTGSAIREGKHVVCNDIETDPRMVVWKDEALKRGYRSLIALPIKLFNEVIGAFSLYAPIPNFFDDEEIDLLDEVASDISYALESIETEKRKKEAEKEIITLNETLEQRVEQRTNQLEAANKELEAFSYSVSHDLRAPLRHINGFISLFMENKTTDLTEEELGYLNIVSHSAMEMGELIDALLSFSRLNRAEIQKTPIDSKQQITQLLELFSEEFKTRKIEIKVNEMPLVKGDYQLIRQVWMNLLSNAIKYTSKREVAKIEIGSVEHDAEIVFFVKDNGAGFNMKYGDKLFGVFQRLHKPRDFEGIGIGLANVNRIITRHGGRCWAEGEVDQGATFYFSLPKLSETN